MRKRLVYNKWYGGISNDPNIGGAGVFYDGENIKIREDSKKITLQPQRTQTSLTSDTANPVMGYLTYDNSKYLRLHYKGHITNFGKNDLDNGNYVTKLDANCYNIGLIETTSYGTKGFIIGSAKLYKWTYDNSKSSLGIYEDGTTGIIANSDFDNATGWTVGTGWAISSGKATHTAGGGTDALSYTSTTSTGVTYRIEVVCGTITADSCQLRFGGVNQYTFSSTDSNKTVVFNYTALANNEVVEFVPSNNFAGSFESINGQTFNITSQAYNFNQYTPYNIYSDFIYIGNGNKVTKVDTSPSTWVISDIFTIDNGFTIKGITRISDQFLIYATDGSNTRQYMWDGVSTSADRIITWVDKPLLNVANFANIDYVITGGGANGKSELFQVNGYQLIFIAGSPINRSKFKQRLYFYPSYTNAIETVGTNLLIPGLGHIYSYGQFTPGLPFSIVKDFDFNHNFSTNSTISSGYVTAMTYTEGASLGLRYSYVGKDSGGTAYIIEDLVQYTSSTKDNYGIGWVETNPITGDTYSNIKNYIKFTLGYKSTGAFSLGVYKKSEGYVVLMTNKDFTAVPTAGAIYTGGGYTFTVVSVQENNAYTDRRIIYCSYTGSGDKDLELDLTKSSGIGDTTFYVRKIKWDWELVSNTTNTTKTRFSDTITGGFNEGQIAISACLFDTSKELEIYDLNLYLDEVTND